MNWHMLQVCISKNHATSNNNLVKTSLSLLIHEFGLQIVAFI